MVKMTKFKNGDPICFVSKAKDTHGDHWGTLRNFDGCRGVVKLWNVDSSFAKKHGLDIIVNYKD
jgi:hypothetical protein